MEANNTSHQTPHTATYLGGDSKWLAFITKEDETEPKPVLSQRMVVLISREGGTTLISVYGTPTLHSHVRSKHSSGGPAQIHLQADRDLVTLTSDESCEMQLMNSMPESPHTTLHVVYKSLLCCGLAR